MSHPYGRKSEVVINETTQRDLERGSPPTTALRFKGRPYKIAEAIVTFLLEKRYCEPGDLIFWAVTYRRNGRPKIEGKIVMEIEPKLEGEENGVQPSAD